MIRILIAGAVCRRHHRNVIAGEDDVAWAWAKELADYAESQGVTKSAVAVEAFRGLLARKKR